ncbi:MAG: shikimate kinase, partial [Elusimicrobiota bacterium]
MRQTIYLTGFMGAGKSVVGKELARLLRRPFIDLDLSIERAAGSSVASLFARRGEEAFRELEHKALLRAAKRVGVVVALGGGTLLDPRHRVIVKKGYLVSLSCSRASVRRARRKAFRRSWDPPGDHLRGGQGRVHGGRHAPVGAGVRVTALDQELAHAGAQCAAGQQRPGRAQRSEPPHELGARARQGHEIAFLHDHA